MSFKKIFDHIRSHIESITDLSSLTYVRLELDLLLSLSTWLRDINFKEYTRFPGMLGEDDVFVWFLWFSYI